MEIEILDESKTKIHFKVHGEDHTVLNLLKEELWKDKNVKISAYRMDHPLVGVPEMTVETASGSDPKKAIADAVKRLNKEFDGIKDQAKTAMK